MQKKYIFSNVLFLFFLGFIFYLSGIIAVLWFLFELFLYYLVALLIYKLWKKIRKKESLDYKEFINFFISKIVGIFALLIIILGSFSYYQNEVAPAKMPTFTISNGKKTVVFQAMSHIGTTNFYKNIREDLRKKKNEGFVYFFEGVKPGTDESKTEFDKALGVQFDKNLYKNFSKIYGVVNQNNEDFLGLVNNLDFNVDLNMDEIVSSYNEKKSIEPQTNLQNKLPLDANAQILDMLNKLNEKELKILVYINQSLLNLIIKDDRIQNLLTENFANKQLFDVILNERNNVLSKSIINSKYDKIFITYGLLHFDGVLELLQQNDKNWKIIGVKYSYPIKE